jgi:hypothetical protein
MEKWLLEHPHFKQKINERDQYGYVFDEEWVIYMDKQFNPFKYKPFDWDRPGYTVDLQDAPIWFLDLYRQAYEKYYHTNRLRYTLANEKMNLNVLVQLFCLTQNEMRDLAKKYLMYEEGDSFTIKTYGDCQEEFEKLKKYLETFDYNFSDIYTKEQTTYGTIR